LQTHYSTFLPNVHWLVRSHTHKKCLTVVCGTGLLLLSVGAGDASEGAGLDESSSITPLLSNTLEREKHRCITLSLEVAQTM